MPSDQGEGLGRPCCRCNGSGVEPSTQECVECGTIDTCVLRFDGEPVCEDCFDIHLTDAYEDFNVDEDM
jgi:recombinational DNA repair protein (RecF pathway)